MEKIVPLKTARKGVQSIEIGFSILAVLQQSTKPLPLKTISERSELAPSKVHSYLVSFCSLDIVIQHSDTGYYSLGSFALKLGLSYLDQFDLFSTSKPIMERLAEDIGETIFLGVWGNQGPSIIHRVDGPQSQTVLDIRVGSVFPLIRSSLGRIFAAHMPKSTIKPILQKEVESNIRTGQYKEDIENPQNLIDVYKMLDKVHADGFSRCRGGLLYDFTAMSVPIFDYAGSIAASLTMIGLRGSLDDEIEGRPAQALIKASKTISSSCGYDLTKK
ncbi:MAG: IclR family transcriptional regulator [Proteobacteria bacterium]|jgi:DNA-binding IclR family transcriptional regulator|nr:IclR family transcriptional regulator [Pseudomonadota bacterium]